MSALRKIRTLYKVTQFLFAVFLILLICTPYMYAAASATKPEDNPVRIAIPVSSVAADYNTASGYMNYTGISSRGHTIYRLDIRGHYGPRFL